MEELTNESYKKMDERHTELVSNITDLLQMLYTVVKEVRVAVDQTPYSIVSYDQVVPSDERPIKTSSTNPRTKIHVYSQAFDLGTSELNVVVKDISNFTFDFFAIPMYQLHVIKHVAVEEMKTRER